jgi:uncharacterized membrane protein
MLRPGQTQYVEVKVTTESSGALPAEPVVTLDGPSDNKVTWGAWTTSDFKSNPVACAIGFAIKAAPDAPRGERKVKVRVTAGPAQVERSFRVAVQPPERKPEPEAKPSVALQLVLPERVEVAAGGTRHLEVQVRTADGSPLPGEPSVSVRPRGSGLRSTPWTASGVKAGQTAYTAGFAVTADPDAIEGEREAMVTVTAGDSTAERTLRVMIKPPPSRVATSP